MGNGPHTQALTGWRWRLWQIGDRLQRRGATSLYPRLIESQYWPVDRLQELAESKLHNLVAHALKHVPYYSARCSGRTLDEFPVLTRAGLQRHAQELLADDADPVLLTLSSSGTTGERVTVKRDRAMQDMSMACAWRGDCWGTDIAPWDRQLTLWGDPQSESFSARLHNRVWPFYRNRFIFKGFMFNADRARKCHWLLWRLRPSILAGYPTSMVAFARFARELGLKPPPIAKVLPTAEQCYPEDAAELTVYFRAPVLERYGAHETGAIGHQCEHGNWHLHCEHTYLEVLKDDGTIARKGAGALLCTTLSNFSMPLVRYEIGDYAELSDEKCPCGRGLPVFRNLEGRFGQFVFCPDGRWITSHGFLAPLRWFDLGGFRLVQDEPGRITLMLAQARLNTGDLNRLRQAYERLHGGTLRVDFEFVSEIPPLPSGKRTRVLCMLPRPENVTINQGS